MNNKQKLDIGAELYRKRLSYLDRFVAMVYAKTRSIRDRDQKSANPKKN